MKIINYGDFYSCDGNNFLKVSVTLKDNISKEDIHKLASEKQLIFNEIYPYFKIISPNFIIRGSLETNRITIEFTSFDKVICHQELEKLFL